MSDKDSNDEQIKQNLALEWIELREKLEQNADQNSDTFLRKIWSKTKENPLVPIGITATTFCLTYGLISMKRGDSKKQQMMMRGRVIAQGFTVLALISGIMYSLVNRAKQ